MVGSRYEIHQPKPSSCIGPAFRCRGFQPDKHCRLQGQREESPGAVVLKDVTVDEDRDKNTITLGGKVHSENAKQQAAELAQAAAGNRILANEISVEPVGAESQSRSIASNQDAAIEKDSIAALAATGLDKEHIRFKAKNGALTLRGSVKNPRERQEA